MAAASFAAGLSDSFGGVIKSVPGNDGREDCCRVEPQLRRCGRTASGNAGRKGKDVEGGSAAVARCVEAATTRRHPIFSPASAIPFFFCSQWRRPVCAFFSHRSSMYRGGGAPIRCQRDGRPRVTWGGAVRRMTAKPWSDKNLNNSTVALQGRLRPATGACGRKSFSKCRILCLVGKCSVVSLFFFLSFV